MGSKLKKLAKYLIRVGLFCFLGLMIASGIGYWQRNSIAEWLGKRMLQKSGVGTAEFHVVELDSQGLRLSEIKLVGEGWILEGERVDIAFSLGDIWMSGALDEIILRNGALVIDRESVLGVESQESMEGDWGGKWDEWVPLPVDRAVVEGFEISVEPPVFRERLELGLELKEGKSALPQIELHLRNDEFNLELDAVIDGKKRVINLSADMKSAEPLALFDFEYSKIDDGELRKMLAGCTIGGVSSNIETTIDLQGVRSAAGSFEVIGASTESADATVSADWLRGQYSIVDNEVIAIEGEGMLNAAQSNSLVFSPARFSYALKGSNLRAFELDSDRFKWFYDSGTGGVASVRAEGRIADELEESELAFEVNAIEQEVSGISLQPFDLKAEGILSELKGVSSGIRFTDYPFVVFDNVSFTLSNVLADAKTVDFSGIANWDEEIIPRCRISSLAILGDTVIEEGKIRWKGSLEALEVALLRKGEEMLEGAFSSRFMGSYEAETELIDSEATFGVSGLSGRWNETRFDEINVEGMMSIEGLDIDHLGSAREKGFAEMVECLWPLIAGRSELLGNELSLSDLGSAKWFSLELEKERSRDSEDAGELAYAWNSGIAELGPETIQQLVLTGSMIAKEGIFEYGGKIAGLLEGEEIRGSLSGEADLRKEKFEARGAFELEPIRFVSSDIASRHMPRLNGVSLSGLVEAEGAYWWNLGASDASIRLKLDSGKIVHPAQDLRIEGVSILAGIASISEMKGSGIQRIDVDSLRYGDTVGKKLKARFSFDGIDRLQVKKAEFELYDGMVSLEPMEMSLRSLDADWRVRFDELSVTPIMGKIDFFDGVVMGKVSGSLPIGLRSGTIEMGEGFLELVEGSEARLIYNAEGLFEEQETSKSFYEKMGYKVLDKLGLNPEDVVEDSLADLPIDRLRIDLFNKSLPDTPIRARITGTADTGKVEVPIDLTVNVKGTMEELLNFLMQMGSL